MAITTNILNELKSYEVMDEQISIPLVSIKDSIIHNITKRIFDIIFSLLGLILFTPLMILLAIMIKLTSSGPVFFSQIRLGKNARPFKFLKFRTMYVITDEKNHKDYIKRIINNKYGEERGAAYSKLKDDPRITHIGRFIRKASFDEIPQLFNVLKGEMSIVGPRPPMPYEIGYYEEWHKSRLTCKPGITGLWQISGRSKTTFDEMVKLDLAYIKNQSLLLDIKILLKTPLTVFRADAL